MSGVRVLVGTHKGAFILTSDGKRNKWDVSGPFFAGWDVYHMKGSPVDPNRIYASQTSGWFGQIIQRSDDGGKTWSTPEAKKRQIPMARQPDKATSLSTTLPIRQESRSPRTSGMTVPSIRGNSSACGISNLLIQIPIPSMPE